MHVEGSPRGKSLGGKIPLKKSPAESTDVSPVPVVPAPSKPGSEEWVYVNEPIPEVWQFRLKLVDSLLSPPYGKIHIAPSKRPFLADNICIYQKSRDDHLRILIEPHFMFFSAPSSFWVMLWAAGEWRNQESKWSLWGSIFSPRRSRDAIFWKDSFPRTQTQKITALQPSSHTHIIRLSYEV